MNNYKDPTIIEKILKNSKTIAIVGLSNRSDRPSYNVASYLAGKGYHIIPVNPMIKEIFGQKSYPDLKSIPEKVDVVDIFRRSEDVGPIVDEAIETGAKAVWMQEGIINIEAAERARAAGIDVVMDLCMLKEHAKRMD